MGRGRRRPGPRLRRDRILRTVCAFLFGETAAVNAFNRVASALRWLATVMLDFVLTSFLDDFPQVEASATAKSAQETLDGMLDPLGWSTKPPADQGGAGA